MAVPDEGINLAGQRRASKRIATGDGPRQTQALDYAVLKKEQRRPETGIVGVLVRGETPQSGNVYCPFSYRRAVSVDYYERSPHRAPLFPPVDAGQRCREHGGSAARDRPAQENLREIDDAGEFDHRRGAVVGPYERMQLASESSALDEIATGDRLRGVRALNHAVLKTKQRGTERGSVGVLVGDEAP